MIAELRFKEVQRDSAAPASRQSKTGAVATRQRSLTSAIWGGRNRSSSGGSLALWAPRKRRHAGRLTRGWRRARTWLDATLPIISPSDNRKRAWDLLIIAFVLYNAVSVPHATAFGYDKSRWQATLDHVIDVMFTTDIALTCRTSYLDASGRPVTRGAAIFRHYLKTWFWIDLVSVLPFEYILLVFGMSANLAVISFLKTPRLLRLGKLLRFLEKMKGANTFRIVRLLLSMFMIAHWMACLWQIIRNWFPRDHWSLPDSGPVLERYLAVYYQAFLLIIGNPSSAPENDIETVFMCVMLVLGTCISAVVVGNMALLVSTLNATTARHAQRLEMVADALRYLNVPPKLSDRVHEYFDHLQTYSHPGPQLMAMLSELPLSVFHDITSHLYKDKLRRLHILDGADEHLLNALCTRLVVSVYPPGEVIFRRGDAGAHACVIHKGIVAVLEEGELMTRLLRDGQHFGEDALVAAWPRTYTATALSSVDLLMLRTSDLAACLAAYPGSAERVRTAADARRVSIEAEAAFHALKVGTFAEMDCPPGSPARTADPGDVAPPREAWRGQSGEARAEGTIKAVHSTGGWLPDGATPPACLTQTGYEPTDDRVRRMLAHTLEKMESVERNQDALLQGLQRLQNESSDLRALLRTIHEAGAPAKPVPDL